MTNTNEQKQNKSQTWWCVILGRTTEKLLAFLRRERGNRIGFLKRGMQRDSVSEMEAYRFRERLSVSERLSVFEKSKVWESKSVQPSQKILREVGESKSKSFLRFYFTVWFEDLDFGCWRMTFAGKWNRVNFRICKETNNYARPCTASVACGLPSVNNGREMPVLETISIHLTSVEGTRRQSSDVKLLFSCSDYSLHVCI